MARVTEGVGVATGVLDGGLSRRALVIVAGVPVGQLGDALLELAGHSKIVRIGYQSREDGGAAGGE